jgi:ribosomal protein S18 acetylase RimI-like enzyme
MRLCLAWAAESEVQNFSLDKVRAAFDRAVRQDRAALIIAGRPGHLLGMVLLGFSYVWFADGAQMTMLAAFVDPGYRQSAVGKELIEFSRRPVHQQEADFHAPMAA